VRHPLFHQRVVAGTTPTLSWQQIDGDGEPADPGTVTVTITRADGTAVVSAAATSGATTEARTYDLAAANTALLDNLTATWASGGTTLATTYIDVVAAPWFSNAELRAEHQSLASTAAYSVARVSAARLHVEMMFERITNRRFVPGYAHLTVPGSCRRDLILPHVGLRSVRSAALYCDLAQSPVETLAAGELAAFPPSPEGIVTRTYSSWYSPWVKVGYEYGENVPPPELRTAAMRVVREVLDKSKTTTPDQATTWNAQDFGWSAVFVTPGVRGAHTSIPSVNEALDAWTFEQVGIA